MGENMGRNGARQSERGVDTKQIDPGQHRPHLQPCRPADQGRL